MKAQEVLDAAQLLLESSQAKTFQLASALKGLRVEKRDLEENLAAATVQSRSKATEIARLREALQRQRQALADERNIGREMQSALVGFWLFAIFAPLLSSKAVSTSTENMLNPSN